MVTVYQRTEFRSWASGLYTGTSFWDSCVWGWEYFGGFRETKGRIMLFHFTLSTFLYKVITNKLPTVNVQFYLLSLKKIIINYQLLIYSYAWVIQDILGAAFCVNILKTLKLPNLKVSFKKKISFQAVML